MDAMDPAPRVPLRVIRGGSEREREALSAQHTAVMDAIELYDIIIVDNERHVASQLGHVQREWLGVVLLQRLALQLRPRPISCPSPPWADAEVLVQRR